MELIYDLMPEIREIADGRPGKSIGKNDCERVIERYMEVLPNKEKAVRALMSILPDHGAVEIGKNVYAFRD